MAGDLQKAILPENQVPTESKTGKPSRSAKAPRGKIIIFGTWCKGCGICAAFCPVREYYHSMQKDTRWWRIPKNAQRVTGVILIAQI
jgi:Pyruvate/2-oxoacid:ferredoxin oxidoreductase delta subunit